MGCLDLIISRLQGSDVFNNFHAIMPNKPTAATECCSCETQVREFASFS